MEASMAVASRVPLEKKRVYKRGYSTDIVRIILSLFFSLFLCLSLRSASRGWRQKKTKQKTRKKMNDNPSSLRYSRGILNGDRVNRNRELGRTRMSIMLSKTVIYRIRDTRISGISFGIYRTMFTFDGHRQTRG